MSFARPTLQTLVDRIAADINARLPGADARLPYSNLNVLAMAEAAAVHGLYGYMDWLAQQILPDTAEVEYLERWASLYGFSRKASAPALGTVTFTGTEGAAIAVGTVVQRADGQQYQTSAASAIASGVATVDAVAVAAGVLGNCGAASALTLVVPVQGVNASCVVAGDGMTGGADAESDDALRTRLVARIQQAPQGGCKSDYEAWALEVAGVTRAWVYSQELGVGTVTVRFVRDNDGPGSAIIPDSSEVAVMQAYLDARRPVTAQLTVVAPTANPLDFTISGLLPGTDAVKAAVQAELQDLLLREAAPGGTVLLSHIRAAISAASGEDDFTLASPSANVTNTTGQMSTMGSITWL